MAKLNRSVPTLAGIDAKYHVLYTKQDDDTYQLDDDVQAADESAADLRARLDEFRTNNKAVMKERDELLEAAKKTAADTQETQEKTKTLQERIDDLEKRASTSDEAAAKANAKAALTATTSALEREGVAQGVDRKAVGRFAEAFRADLEVNDNDEVVVAGDSKTTLSEFVTAKLQQETFWAAASKGDGADGDGDDKKTVVKKITDEEYTNADEETHKGVADGTIEVLPPEE